MKWQRFYAVMCVVTFIALWAGAGSIHAESVVANFDDGNTETEIDAFRGMAGDGWQDAWSFYDDGKNGTPNVQVENTTEIKTGWGNYLRMAATATGSDARYTEGRQYGASGATIDLSLTDPVMYEFTIRINEDVDAEDSTFDYRQDRYMIMDYPSVTDNGSPLTTWAISVIGEDKDSTDDLEAKEWQFKNGDNNTHDSPVPTGIYVATGGVYDFTIVADPTDQTWDATISQVGGDSFTQEGMGWRTRATQLGGFLNFNLRSQSSGETRDWSIDGITITQIPEPSTGVLVLIGTLGACLFRRRRV